MVLLDSFKVLIHGIFGDGADLPWTPAAPRSRKRCPSGKTPFPGRRPGVIFAAETVHHTRKTRIPMPIVNVVLTLIVIGVLLWLINLIPMQSTIKSILNAVVVIAVVLWLLYGFGIISHGDIKLPVVK
jgi:uncharacterized membrane protein